MLKKLPVLPVAALSLAVAFPAEGQWVPFTPNNNSAEYWDNASSDGASCNIGFVVTGVAGSSAATACRSQRPDPWLPFTNTAPPVDRFNATQLFTLFGGQLQISQLTGSGGDVAGEDRDWGIWTSATFGGAKTKTSVNANPFIGSFTGMFWGFWVNTSDGIDKFSDADQQFARFSRSTGCANPVFCGPMVIGIEDADTRVGGDRDYQDMVALVSFIAYDDFDDRTLHTVPEPSTYALMVAGLAAIGLVLRRRRRS